MIIIVTRIDVRLIFHHLMSMIVFILVIIQLHMFIVLAKYILLIIHMITIAKIQEK